MDRRGFIATVAGFGVGALCPLVPQERKTVTYEFNGLPQGSEV